MSVKILKEKNSQLRGETDSQFMKMIYNFLDDRILQWLITVKDQLPFFGSILCGNAAIWHSWMGVEHSAEQGKTEEAPPPYTC